MKIDAMKKDDFYRQMFKLTIPIIIQNLLSAAVNSADVIMLNYVGQSAISAVSLAANYSNILFMVYYGLGTGASLLCAQYYGKGNHKGHMYSFRFKLYATLLVTGLTILLFVTKGADLISLYLTDTAGSGATEVALQYGLEYLGIMMVGLIPFAVNQSYATNIKETGQTVVFVIRVTYQKL
jgi:Na+-driven multidrug efflux pump